MGLPEPYYADEWVALYHGDAREILPALGELQGAVLVTDPPYGVGWTGTSRHDRIDPVTGRRRRSKTRQTYIGLGVTGDDRPFDPAHLLALGLPTVIFGANHFASRLPDSPSWIVWDKRDGLAFGPNQADCEMAWTNLGGPARIVRLVWNVTSRVKDLKAEGGNGRLADSLLHPTQKPGALMRSIIQRCPAGVIVDPYAGSGTTLRAAKDLGRKAIGCEIDERWCETAAKRLGQEVLPLEAA